MCEKAGTPGLNLQVLMREYRVREEFMVRLPEKKTFVVPELLYSCQKGSVPSGAAQSVSRRELRDIP